jgi:hypothetical protein
MTYHQGMNPNRLIAAMGICLARIISPDNLVPLPTIDFSNMERLPLTNDTAVFDAMRPDPKNGEREWAGRMGTRDAIRRDGLEIDAASLTCTSGSIAPAISTLSSCASFR